MVHTRKYLKHQIYHKYLKHQIYCGPHSQKSEATNISYWSSIRRIEYPNGSLLSTIWSTKCLIHIKHQINRISQTADILNSLLVDPTWASVGLGFPRWKIDPLDPVPFNSPTEMTPWRVILGVNRVLCVKLQEFWNCSVLKHQNLFIRSLWVGMTRAWMDIHFAKIDFELTLWYLCIRFDLGKVMERKKMPLFLCRCCRLWCDLFVYFTLYLRKRGLALRKAHVKRSGSELSAENSMPRGIVQCIFYTVIIINTIVIIVIINNNFSSYSLSSSTTSP